MQHPNRPLPQEEFHDFEDDVDCRENRHLCHFIANAPDPDDPIVSRDNIVIHDHNCGHLFQNRPGSPAENTQRKIGGQDAHRFFTYMQQLYPDNTVRYCTQPHCQRVLAEAQ